MKKFISIILALVLCLGCCSAFADTVDAKSATSSVTVKKYVLNATVDKLLLADDSGTTVSTTLNVSRTYTTSIKLSSGTATPKTITGATVSASDVRDYAKSVAAAGATSIVVKVVSVGTSVTGKDGKAYSGETNVTEFTEAEVLVLLADDNLTEEQKKNGDGGATKGLLSATVTVPTADIFPGDEIKVTGATDATALKAVVGALADVTITNTYIYMITDNGTATLVKTGTGASAEYTLTAADAGTVYKFWVVGSATITQK